MLSNAVSICPMHMPDAMRRACARTYGRTNEELTYLSRYLSFGNARRGGSKKSPQWVTAKPAAATRQAVNHA